ncbi:MAG: hypothetical protein IKY37_07925 [Bacteroidaceae bacterium]|nr:hypothetical protein [Bacteroidaceae bacterium]
MSTSMLLTGLNGALGLYSSVKGIIDSAKESSRQKKLQKMARAEEDAWYRRNYYGNYLDNSASRAAIKRVENSLRRQNEQNRAFSAIHGTTPENAIARNEQGLRSMENLYTNIASRADDHKMQVDAAHRQNKNALLANELAESRYDEKVAGGLASGGLNLLQNALLGVEWGKERRNNNQS